MHTQHDCHFEIKTDLLNTWITLHLPLATCSLNTCSINTVTAEPLTPARCKHSSGWRRLTLRLNTPIISTRGNEGRQVSRLNAFPRAQVRRRGGWTLGSPEKECVFNTRRQTVRIYYSFNKSSRNFTVIFILLSIVVEHLSPSLAESVILCL